MVRAKGGDFHDFPAEGNMDDTKTPANDTRPPEPVLNLLGSRVGGDIEVLGVKTEE